MSVYDSGSGGIDLFLFFFMACKWRLWDFVWVVSDGKVGGEIDCG